MEIKVKQFLFENGILILARDTYIFDYQLENYTQSGMYFINTVDNVFELIWEAE